MLNKKDKAILEQYEYLVMASGDANLLLLEDSIRKLTTISYDTDAISNNLYKLYEMEYKYSIIRQKETNIHPTRYDNIIEMLETGILKVCAHLAETLIPVFDQWLKQHALTDPEIWAQSRVDNIIDSPELDALFFNLFSEWSRYHLNFKLDANYGFNLFRNRIQRMSDNMLKDISPTLYNIINVIMKIDNVYEEEQYTITEYLSFILEAGDYIDFQDILEKEIDLDEFMIICKDLYKTFVFPLWYDYWSREGIIETRKNIEEKRKNLNKIAQGWDGPLTELTSIMNEIIQVTHQTGSLVQDYGELYGSMELDDHFFRWLSELEPEKEGWNEELREIGVDI